MAPRSETSLLRKSIIAVGLAVGGTTLLMSGWLLLMSTALDHALSVTPADTVKQPDLVEVAAPSAGSEAPRDVENKGAGPNRS